MKDFLSGVAACVLLAGLAAGTPALAQKKGGVLRIYQYDSPASMSIHEEALNSAQNPMMAVFNNLVIFKQDVPQNRMDTIVPDLATKWSWNADMTALTFQLRHGVSWHDGKPFTAADVKCTWDLILGNGSGQTARQPAQVLVPQPRVGQHQRRHGDVPSEKAAAGLYCAACLGLFAGLSVSRPAAEHAAAPDRHRAVQIRLLQAERIDQARTQCTVLEAGTPLSRRHRMDDNSQPLDGDSRLSSPASSI